MANIKIGNLEIDNLKVGTLSVDALYIGDVKIYPSMPPGPTPTYEWKQYNAGDTIPSKLFYGVKLGDPSMEEVYIEFWDTQSAGIAFTFDVNSEYGWYAQDMSGEQIDISEYYDETESCFIIYFSDLGLGAMPLYYPAPSDSFEFDVQLYQEYVPQTLQWVSFSAGDAVPSGDVYGIKVSGATAFPSIISGSFFFINDSNDLNVYNGARNRWYYDSNNCGIYEVELGFRDDNWELMFNTVCGVDYYSVDTSETTVIPYDCQLYIYA